MRWLLLCCMVLQLVESSGVRVAPSGPVPNTCESSRPIFQAKRVKLDVVLYRFCDLSLPRQEQYRASKETLKEALRRFGIYLREQLQWNVAVTVTKRFDACAPPTAHRRFYPMWAANETRKK